MIGSNDFKTILINHSLHEAKIDCTLSYYNEKSNNFVKIQLLSYAQRIFLEAQTFLKANVVSQNTPIAQIF